MCIFACSANGVLQLALLNYKHLTYQIAKSFFIVYTFLNVKKLGIKNSE